MSSVERIFDPLTITDLKHLKGLALREHEAFFERNPHLKSAYHNWLIGICLCQGAASHYLNTKVGVKDFDIWHFYVETGHRNFPYRFRKTIENGYKGRPIDFLKRAIPKDTYDSSLRDPKQTIMKYLLERNTKSKRCLLRKAIIGLSPNTIFGRVLWKGDL